MSGEEGMASRASRAMDGAHPIHSPASEPSAPVLDPKHWEVTVYVCGEPVVTIGSHGHLAGVTDDELERVASAIRAAGEHLTAFIGPEEAQPCFGCGGSGQERWMGPCGEEVGPCSVCCAEDAP